MIDKAKAWDAVLVNAKKALLTDLSFHSLIEKKEYKILGIENDKISIQRVSGGENDVLTKSKVFAVLEVFNQQNGKVKRRSLISPTVAKETTLVLFCPYLTWDNTGEYIIEIK